MKYFMLIFCVTFINLSHAMIVKDPKIIVPEGQPFNVPDYLPIYNPYSLYVPSTNILIQLPPDRVLDMGAIAYANSFFQKSLYFYTNAVELFANDSRIVSSALYETAYIYYVKKQHKKALEILDKIIQIPGTPTAIQLLTKSLRNKIVNYKAYELFLKQEDVVFLEDKKAQAMQDRQIGREERAAAKRRRELVKERKAREKAEKKAAQEAEKKMKELEKK